MSDLFNEKNMEVKEEYLTDEDIITYLQSQKYVSEQFSERNETQKNETKVKFLDSTECANKNSQQNTEIRYLTSDEDTSVVLKPNTNSLPTSRRRSLTSRRQYEFGDYDDNDNDEDYIPTTTRRRSRVSTSQIESEPSRPRSTRYEASNARNRISFYSMSSDEDEELELEPESIVRLDEISLASESDTDAFITFEDLEMRRDFENEILQCIICAEPKAINPVKALCCGQFLGCQSCVKLWFRTTNISDLNSYSPLSRGQSHENHKRCPFCRTDWFKKMLIKSI